MCSSASPCCLLLELGWTRFAGAYKFGRTTEFWKMHSRLKELYTNSMLKLKWNSMSQHSPFGSLMMCCDFCHLGKTPKKINLSSRRLILPHSSRAQPIMVAGERGNWFTIQLLLGSRGQWMLPLGLLPSLYSVLGSRSWNGTTHHLKWVFLSLLTLSQTRLEICLLGDSRIYPVNINNINIKTRNPANIINHHRGSESHRDSDKNGWE